MQLRLCCYPLLRGAVSLGWGMVVQQLAVTTSPTVPTVPTVSTVSTAIYGGTNRCAVAP